MLDSLFSALCITRRVGGMKLRAEGVRGRRRIDKHITINMCLSHDVPNEMNGMKPVASVVQGGNTFLTLRIEYRIQPLA